MIFCIFLHQEPWLHRGEGEAQWQEGSSTGRPPRAAQRFARALARSHCAALQGPQSQQGTASSAASGGGESWD